MDIKSLLMATVKDAVPDPPAEIGASYEGGFYAGMVLKSDGFYAIVVVPLAAMGATTTIQWKTTQTADPGARSLVEGQNNTAAIDNASHQAAQFCANLSYNGHTDWYLPARDELELMYRNLKPTTETSSTSNRNKSAIVYTPNDDLSADVMGTNRSSEPTSEGYGVDTVTQTPVTIFQTGNSEAFVDTAYWTSTEVSDTLAWRQGFNNGFQIGLIKDTFNARIRPIRSVKL